MRRSAALLARFADHPSGICATARPSFGQVRCQAQAAADWQADDSEPSSSATGPEYASVVLQTELRSTSGSKIAAKLRKEGRTPATLQSLPGNESQLLSLDSIAADALVRKFGRRGVTSRVFALQIGDGLYPGLPRMVHINAVSLKVENISFMYCPPDRLVVVQIPVQIMGEDLCPGIRQGGFPSLVRRRLPCLCRGGKIPSSLTADISGLGARGKLLPGDIPLPADVQLALQDLTTPVLKITGKSRPDSTADDAK